MAKKSKDSYVRAKGNRGEDFDEPERAMAYDYMPESQYDARSQERAKRRDEVRAEYSAMYQLEQRRDQRDFNRTQDMSNEFYAGVDPRRRQEVADGGMIREQHSAMANLPLKAQHHEYPQAGYYATPYIDDTVRGANESPDDDGQVMERHQLYRRYR
jgi:hypothetical protein